jgi:electron transfer flavoprotein beta subunit
LAVTAAVAELRILVLVKRVPAPGARIVVTSDGQEIETRHLGFTTSPHEECAVEEAIRLVEAHGGAVTVMALGPPEAAEQLRYALSVGADLAVLVTHEDVVMRSGWDAQATSRALVRAISDLEEAGGPFDLMLFGNESADSGGFQVGVRVARALGRPIVNGIKGIEIDGDGVVTVRREGNVGLELYRLTLPAALGVKEGINLPRYPTLRGRLKSKAAEVAAVPASAEGGGLVTTGLRTPQEQVSETTVLGTGPEAAIAVVDLLQELGLA